MSKKRFRITCQQNPHGIRPGVHFANVWSTDGKRTQLGHGEGSTRGEAIKAAQQDRRARGL